MKKISWALYAILGFFLFLNIAANAQDASWPAAKPEDVSSASATVKASYDAISCSPGQVLNLDRFRSLFLPHAQLVSVSLKEGHGLAHVMTMDEFSKMVVGSVGKGGHVEHELAERVEIYGNIANVWSSYESRNTPDDPHIMRGINSIQLFNDGKRWWISGAQWQHETADAPIPAKYLSTSH
jgi:hypothetical protein